MEPLEIVDAARELQGNFAERIMIPAVQGRVEDLKAGAEAQIADLNALLASLDSTQGV